MADPARARFRRVMRGAARLAVPSDWSSELRARPGRGGRIGAQKVRLAGGPAAPLLRTARLA
eukprot:15453051-Alexandrium_andersonii.AAC.1